MKRFFKLAALLLLVFGGGGFGFWRYMHADDQGQAAEAAADALVSAANAAAEWARDTSTHEVSVVNLMGMARGRGIDGPVVVEARIFVKGGRHLSALCASLPRAHDAVNMVLSDPMGAMLRRRAPLAGDSLSAYADALREKLNREIAPDTVSTVKVVVRHALDMQERGCTDLKSGKTEAARN